jgi:hypothetical protein
MDKQELQPVDPMPTAPLAASETATRTQAQFAFTEASNARRARDTTGARRA